jgi:tetratricopeptide (TPR) repeat protein
MRLAKFPPPLKPPEVSAGERLDSWKEIAAYLKRDVRTVRQWEQHEGLPVHRHVHSKQASVYAYRAELDAWWNNRRPRLEQQGQVGTVFRWRLWLALAAVALATAGLGLVVRLSLAPPPLGFQQRDWVLIANFENRTGEPLFDDALEYALERELSNSSFVNVVPRERIDDVLRLMKKRAGIAVDAALGREISLRDGGIRALLSGRVEKFGRTYVLSVALVEPASGRKVASASEDVASHDAFPIAVRRLSHQVRQTLGEVLPFLQSHDQLERVTTPSLRALQLYTRAMALVNEYQWEPAAELLRQAVGEDPTFASAHILLAHCYGNLRRDEEAAPHYQRAFELAETTTDRERYFILGGYYSWQRNDAKALHAYEVLVRLYPDDYWGTNNLAFAYERLGRLSEALGYVVRRAALRPNDFNANQWAAHGLAIWEGDAGRAASSVQRARELLSMEPATPNTGPAAWVILFPAYERWLQGETGQVLAEVDRVAQTVEAGRRFDILREHIGYAYLTLGKLDRAEEMFRSLPETFRSVPWNRGRQKQLALVAWVRGDKRAVGQLLRATPPSFESAILLTRIGQLSEAEALIPSKLNNAPGLRAPLSILEPVGKTVRGEMALARGRTGEAIQLLEEGVPALLRTPRATIEFFLGSEALARAWELQGDSRRALQTLEAVSRRKAWTYSTDNGLLTGYFWMTVEWQQAQLYRKLGRLSDAQRIEAELLKHLAHADPDHPLLVRLRRGAS